MKNIHKRKNLMGLIYAIVMCIPFFTILVRCIYVQLNANAVQSYSGSNGYQINYKYTSNEVTSSNDLISGRIYTFTLTGQPSVTTTYFRAYRIIQKDVNLDIQLSFEETSGYLTLLQSGTSGNILIQKDGISTLYTLTSNYITYPIQFDVVYMSNAIDYTSFSVSSYNEIDNVTLDNSGTLDNAFEYSLSEITKNNNIGRLNLVNWFADVFLDMNNSHNALYLNFVNWYMNYSLFVSCVYLLYLVLMWFLCLARRILSKGFKDEL